MHLYVNDMNLFFSPCLASQIGVEETLVLQQLHNQLKRQTKLCEPVMFKGLLPQKKPKQTASPRFGIDLFN